nr:unnamed protein product [Fasciola hepatica]
MEFFDTDKAGQPNTVSIDRSKVAHLDLDYWIWVPFKEISTPLSSEASPHVSNDLSTPHVIDAVRPPTTRSSCKIVKAIRFQLPWHFSASIYTRLSGALGGKFRRACIDFQTSA